MKIVERLESADPERGAGAARAGAAGARGPTRRAGRADPGHRDPAAAPAADGWCASRRSSRCRSRRVVAPCCEQSRLVGGAQPIGARPRRGRRRPAGQVLRADRASAAIGPLLVFFHGGGWIYGDLDSHDAVCRVPGRAGGGAGLAVDYRLAPEAPFPAAYDDCVNAYAEILERADEWHADRDRIAVGGDSAGGNLATLVAIEAARQGWPCAFQLLVYPVHRHDGHDDEPACCSPTASTSPSSSSTSRASTTCPTSSCGRTRGSVRRTPTCRPGSRRPSSPRPASTRCATRARPTSRGCATAGVEVRHVRYPGLIHGFFNMVGVGRSAADGRRRDRRRAPGRLGTLTRVKRPDPSATGVVPPGHRRSAGGRRGARRRLSRRLAGFRRRSGRRRHLLRHLGLRDRGPAAAGVRRPRHRLLVVVLRAPGPAAASGRRADDRRGRRASRAAGARLERPVDRPVAGVAALTSTANFYFWWLWRDGLQPRRVRGGRAESAHPHVDARGGGAVLPAGPGRRARHAVARARADRASPYDAAAGPARRRRSVSGSPPSC